MDKPTMLSDTIILVKEGIDQIQILAEYLPGTPQSEPIIIGTWHLEPDSSQLILREWLGDRPYTPRVAGETRKRKYIKEYRGLYTVTHRISAGRIIRTKTKRPKVRSSIEDMFFDRIEYTYDSSGLLIEATYYKDGALELDMPYMKYRYLYHR